MALSKTNIENMDGRKLLTIYSLIIISLTLFGLEFWTGSKLQEIPRNGRWN